MSDVILGYAPVDGRLVLGRCRDHRGNWVEPLYAHDDLIIVEPTELDKAVLGADTEHVVAVLRNATGEERYRLAANISWHGLNEADAPREDEILQHAAQVRFEPNEDDNPSDARTLATKPTA